MPAATAQAAPACRLARLHRHLQATSTTPAAAATNTKRKAIYIVCDSEGGAGMPEFWARNAEYDNPRRQEYRELLTRDCNGTDIPHLDSLLRRGAHMRALVRQPRSRAASPQERKK